VFRPPVVAIRNFWLQILFKKELFILNPTLLFPHFIFIKHKIEGKRQVWYKHRSNNKTTVKK
jgi:hypothetical protein